ncbi:MAG: hypothetical protein QME96_15325 [Myxococcota bacterium]|nr:hypothetical protein [Myxococcota bacterium]
MDAPRASERGDGGARGSECKTNMRATVDAETAPCDEGQTYNAATADRCISEMRAMTRDALRAGATPASCNAICT